MVARPDSRKVVKASIERVTCSDWTVVAAHASPELRRVLARSNAMGPTLSSAARDSVNRLWVSPWLGCHDSLSPESGGCGGYTNPVAGPASFSQVHIFVQRSSSP